MNANEEVKKVSSLLESSVLELCEATRLEHTGRRS